MAAQPDVDVANLERLRSRLEENVAKLQKALSLWQSWDFEYEALKEEIQALKDPTQEQILKIGQTFGGDLVDEREMKELSGASRGLNRSPTQIVAIVARRQDDVRKNIETLAKQLSATQEKLESLIGVKQEFEDEEGLPIMDIMEELDEDGNVISGSVAAPSQAASMIVEALDKAGVDIANPSATIETPVRPSEEVETQPKSVQVSDWPEIDPTEPMKLDGESPAPRKKSVAFTEDTKDAAPEPVPSSSGKRELNPDIAKDFFTTDTSGYSRVVELDENDLPIGSMPIIPRNETVEEAALRREMIQYGLQEVGAVVAEINLEEGVNSDDDYDDEEEYDDDEEDMDTEEEDSFGRSTRPIISDAYREKMLKLQAELDARMIENVGPRPEDDLLENIADEELAKSAHRLVIQKDSTKPGPKSKDGSKKGVRFAEELDVSPAPNPVNSDVTDISTKPAAASTISESIIERTGPTSNPSAQAPKPKKVSRFRADRSGSKAAPTFAPATGTSVPPTKENPQFSQFVPDLPRERPVPKGPEGQILSSDIIEHDSIQPPTTGPDELDQELLRREVETQYHKMHNRMIQNQGGFLPEDDEDDGFNDLVEEKEDGRIKKVSKFKAARLKAGGM